MTKEEGFAIMCSASNEDLVNALSRLMGERRILASQACLAYNHVLKEKQGECHASVNRVPRRRPRISRRSLPVQRARVSGS